MFIILVQIIYLVIFSKTVDLFLMIDCGNQCTSSHDATQPEIGSAQQKVVVTPFQDYGRECGGREPGGDDESFAKDFQYFTLRLIQRMENAKYGNDLCLH